MIMMRRVKTKPSLGRGRTEALCGIILLLLLSLPVSVYSGQDGGTTDGVGNCNEAVELLHSQKKSISRDFRQMKRDIALLKETMGKPGITEIVGGIGYILGIFGISYYWLARNSIKKN